MESNAGKSFINFHQTFITPVFHLLLFCDVNQKFHHNFHQTFIKLPAAEFQNKIKKNKKPVPILRSHPNIKEIFATTHWCNVFSHARSASLPSTPTALLQHSLLSKPRGAKQAPCHQQVSCKADRGNILQDTIDKPIYRLDLLTSKFIAEASSPILISFETRMHKRLPG